MKNLEIEGGIHLIKCPWSTYFVSSCLLLGESIVLVDAGTQDSPEEAIYPYIRSIGRDPSEISHIILTHAHFDHCGGASIIKRDTGCKVLVHKFGRPYLEDAALIDRELHERDSHPYSLHVRLNSNPSASMKHSRTAMYSILRDGGYEYSTHPVTQPAPPA